MALSLQAMINGTGLQLAIDGSGNNPISLDYVAEFTEVYESSSGSTAHSLAAIADDQNYNY